MARQAGGQSRFGVCNHGQRVPLGTLSEHLGDLLNQISGLHRLDSKDKHISYLLPQTRFYSNHPLESSVFADCSVGRGHPISSEHIVARSGQPPVSKLWPMNDGVLAVMRSALAKVFPAAANDSFPSVWNGSAGSSRAHPRNGVGLRSHTVSRCGPHRAMDWGCEVDPQEVELDRRPVDRHTCTSYIHMRTHNVHVYLSLSLSISLSLSLSLYIYIYTYVYISLSLYIYMYIHVYTTKLHIQAYKHTQTLTAHTFNICKHSNTQAFKHDPSTSVYIVCAILQTHIFKHTYSNMH